MKEEWTKIPIDFENDRLPQIKKIFEQKIESPISNGTRMVLKQVLGEVENYLQKSNNS